jgi:hypothetical protein
MLYAITINYGNSMFAPSCDNVITKLILELGVTYCDVVNHSNDHFHALIFTETELKNTPEFGKMFHFEKVRNIQAYTKYMHNHDVTQFALMGELPYFETESIIDYLEAFGPTKTVQKYGLQALRQYRNLKEYYNDLAQPAKE